MEQLDLRWLVLGAAFALAACNSPSSDKPSPATDKRALAELPNQSTDYICDHLLVKAESYANELILTLEDKSHSLQLLKGQDGYRYQNLEQDIAFTPTAEGATLDYFNHRHLCRAVTIQTPKQAINRLATPFHAAGNEPGWQLTIENRRLQLISDYGQKQLEAELEPAMVKYNETIHAVSNEGPIELNIKQQLCHDTMSGMPYPFAVSLQLADQKLQGCGGNPEQLLRQQGWEVLTVGDKMLLADSRISLLFNGSQQLSGLASCNRYTTHYQISGEGLAITPTVTTQMACSPQLMEQEAYFLEQLAKVNRFDIDANGQLILLTVEGEKIIAQPQ